MPEPALHLIPEPEPGGADAMVRLRARIATDIADGRRTDVVLAQLITTLTESLDGADALIVTIRDDVARVRASDAPRRIQRLIHGQHRRQWFGSWAAAYSRRVEVVVPEVAASSLYREHCKHFVHHKLLAARAVPLRGRHGRIAGALVVYLADQRILTDDELDVFDEVAALASLAIKNEQAKQELLDRIRHDPLTGLENRDGLEEHIRSALTAAGSQGRLVGLLFVDIDDLTLVNDSLGHTAGDSVIAATADRIKRQLLPGDAVVRFGGDEFIVVLEHIDDIGDARNVAERIRSAVGEKIRLDDNELTTTVCIGITTGDADTPALQLIDEGHAAVVRAKQSGRASTAVHDRALDTGASDRLDREMRLREGLEHDEFVLYWQPKVHVPTGLIVGAEALVRWEHPELGVLSPDAFLSTAERAGLINMLGDWILARSVKEAGAFCAVDPGFSVAVNMSATQLVRDGILESISSALAANDVGPEHLIIELTESVLANSRVEQLLHSLRELGVRSAIDDFGTGYSSLAYVQQLPIDMIKVDRAFVHGLDEAGRGAPVLKAAIAMAKALGMKTTVEGVETESQLIGLRALGVDWAQGYLFSEPCPQANLLALMNSETRW